MVLLKLLEKIPFFHDFTSEELTRFIEGDSFFANYHRGDHIIREGGVDHALFILIKGAAVVTKENKPEMLIASLKPGTTFGEISFLTHQARTTNVIASEECTVFRLDGKMLAKMDLSIQNKIKDQLITVLVKRLDEMNMTLVRLAR
ncbi:MAG: cyclic nucleotide-binding domain-containing protein [Magnetococcales bacterium]|nr:cyclic nucleotide-binding domain-containing protein [Magnetococcales bacterium]